MKDDIIKLKNAIKDLIDTLEQSCTSGDHTGHAHHLFDNIDLKRLKDIREMLKTEK